MKLKSLKVENNEILGDLIIDFTDDQGKPVDTIILAGENGSGKSTILNLIYEFSLLNLLTKHLSNEKRTYVVELNDLDISYLKQYLPEGPVQHFRDGNICSELIINYDLSIQSNWKQIKISYTTLSDGKSYEVYGNQFNQVKTLFKSVYSDTEINFNSKDIKNITTKNIDEALTDSIKSNSQTATEITQLLIDIQALDDADFTSWARNTNSTTLDRSRLDMRIKRFQDAFSYMFPTKKYKEVVTLNGSKRVVFDESGRNIFLENLSSGEKQIVFRGGFLLKDQQSVRGNMVLIDEPEISLHPRWQLRILDFFKRLFNDDSGKQTSQIFVATHSPFILHNDNRINDKVLVLTRNDLGKIEVNENGTFFGWSPEAIIAKAFSISLELNGNNPLIITEGKTDWKHLKRALSELKSHGIFTNLNIDFYEYENDMGDDDLKKMCQHYSKTPQPKKIIFIFDRDKPKMVQEIQDGCNFKEWGNNVYSFAIPVPDHRKETPDISIEFFYTDTEIKKKDTQGRRLYVSDEFHPKTGRHIVEDLNCTDSKYRSGKFSVIDDCVYNKDNQNVALTKNDFAENILNNKEGYENFSFIPFQKIFDIVNDIVSK